MNCLFRNDWGVESKVVHTITKERIEHFRNAKGNLVATRQLEAQQYSKQVIQQIAANKTQVVEFELEQPHPDAIGLEFNFL